LRNQLDWIVLDERGRTWRFEMHPYCGPIVLGARGDPLSRQPGSRSPFWPAFEKWQQAHPRESDPLPKTKVAIAKVLAS
jgi:hypothetical protein